MSLSSSALVVLLALQPLSLAAKVGIGLIAFAFALLVAIGVSALLLRRRRPSERTAVAVPNLSIDLDALTLDPLPSQAPAVEVFGQPTRLAVLVLARAGLGVPLPDRSQWRQLTDQICPGFSRALDFHQPIFRQWPDQVSIQGFRRAFFANMCSQESDQGPHHWIKASGHIDWQGHHVLVGVVFRTESPTGLSPLEMDTPGQWRDAIRMRDPAR